MRFPSLGLQFSDLWFCGFSGFVFLWFLHFVSMVLCLCFRLVDCVSGFEFPTGWVCWFCFDFLFRAGFGDCLRLELWFVGLWQYGDFVVFLGLILLFVVCFLLALCYFGLLWFWVLCDFGFPAIAIFTFV